MEPSKGSKDDSSAASTSSPHKEKKVKGILKNKHEHVEPPEVKWDEMNILETYHPANKDYGHMKIDEPPTPYNYEYDEESSANIGDVSEKLKVSKPREDYVSDDGSCDEDKFLSEKALEKKKKFREHRKNHYNEFSNIKKARELIAKEMAELEKEEEES